MLPKKWKISTGLAYFLILFAILGPLFMAFAVPIWILSVLGYNTISVISNALLFSLSILVYARFSEWIWPRLLGFIFFRVRQSDELFRHFYATGQYRTPESLFKQYLRIKPKPVEEARRKAAVCWLIEKHKNSLSGIKEIDSKEMAVIGFSKSKILLAAFVTTFVALLGSSLFYSGLRRWIYTPDEIPETYEIMLALSGKLSNLMLGNSDAESFIFHLINSIALPAMLLFIAWKLRSGVIMLVPLVKNSAYIVISAFGIKLKGKEQILWEQVEHCFVLIGEKDQPSALELIYNSKGVLKHTKVSLEYADIRPDKLQLLIGKFMLRHQRVEQEVNDEEFNDTSDR